MRHDYGHGEDGHHGAHGVERHDHLEEEVAGRRQVDEEAHVLVRRDAQHPELAQRKALTIVHSLELKEIYKFYDNQNQVVFKPVDTGSATVAGIAALRLQSAPDSSSGSAQY